MDFVQYYGGYHQQNFRERQDYVDRTTEIMIIQRDSFVDRTCTHTYDFLNHYFV